MARSFIVYQGEDELPEFDLTEPTSDVHVIWEEIEAGGRAFQGESTTNSIPLRDERGETGNELNLPSGMEFISISRGSRWEWRENVGEANEVLMAAGRIGTKDYSRGRQKADRAREVTIQAADRNEELTEIIIDDWVRPEETDVARVNALITAYLSGTPRATTVLANTYVASGNTVTMPAKTYDGTNPKDVLSEVALQANKLFFVTVDDEVFYDTADSTAYPAGLRISDRVDELDDTCSGATATAYSEDFESYAIGETPHQGVQTSDFDVSDGGAKFLCIGSSSGSHGFPSDLAWGGEGPSTIPVTPGGVYTVTARVAKRDAGPNPVDKVSVEWRDETSGAPSPGTVGTPITLKAGDWANATWYDLSAEVTAPADAHFLTIYFSAILDGWYLGSLSVEGAAVNDCTFPPIWDVGPASTEDGLELVSGLRLYYGQDGAYVYVNHAATAASYWHAERSFYTQDPAINDSTKATALANAMLTRLRFEERTYNVSIGPLNENQIGCIKPGQLIDIKARAIPDADDQFVSRRIAQLKWTTPVPGVFFARMQLDRPIKELPYGIGAKQGHDALEAHKEGDSHPASAIVVTDAGGYFTGTDVEAALQEAGAALAGITSPTVVDHGNMGATETFDASDGSDHEGTQDANLTVTLTGATAGTAAWMTLVLTQDGTGGRTLTLPASVVNASDVETAWDTTANAVNVLNVFTYDGGTTWYGFLAGSGGSSVGALDDLSDVVIASPANKQVLAHDGTDWNNRTLISEAVVYDNGGTLEHVTNGAGDDWLFVNLME